MEITEILKKEHIIADLKLDNKKDVLNERHHGITTEESHENIIENNKMINNKM